MRRYEVPLDLRARLFGELDPLLRRLLRACGIAAALVAVVLLLVPTSRPEPPQRRVAPSERLARVLNPKPPPKPRRAAPTPTPRRARPAPAPESSQPQARPAPQRKSGAKPRAAAKPPPVAGKRGREAGEAVAQTLQKTTSSIDNLLSSLEGSVPVGVGGEDTAPGASQLQQALRGGRGASQLASIDGLLESTGAGRGGRSRGVAKTGVEVVDDGVTSSGDAASTWGRDSNSLMAVVQRYKSGVKFCYDSALKKSPNLSGKITLQMDISASGAVQDLHVASDSLGDPALQRCILAQVCNWRFQAIDAGTVRFTLPLVFTPPRG
ncbi:MAG: TonB family protein [Candidatus Latescibacterota bacterium]|nr:MAG: TonB family protein [Candidatus Latescibacterota bacterium]